MKKFTRFLSSKYTFHYVLWIVVTLSLALDSRALYAESKNYFFFYLLIKTAVLAAIVYLNILWLYPQFYKQRKYITFSVMIVFMAVVAGAVNMQLEVQMWPVQFFKDSTEHFFFFLTQLLMALRYILFSFFLKITVDYYQQKETIKKIEVEKATAELNFLKAQVNPHFLFNTLNNLYALILEKSDKSGEAVLKLADIMKYILAEGTEDKVILQKEIDLLYNYTELERLRKPDAEITFNASGNTGNCLITPLLLLPLVENAFKYGLNSVSKNGFVRINITAETRKLYVTVENNVPPVSNNDALQSLGLGIENVNKRLQMLYAGKYTFNIESRRDSYFVNLQLQLA